MSNIVHDSPWPARVAIALALCCAALAAPVLRPAPLLAQGAAPMGTERIAGTVTSGGGQPVGDVQVTVVGTRLGAVTAPNGTYAIPGVAAGTYTVRAQRIGYAPGTQQVTVVAGTTATANFTLDVVATSLSEVVTVGYTQQERRTVSDAVSSVEMTDVASQPQATVEEKLRGRIPGVNVVATGEPGRGAQVIIRGMNFLAGVSPLYVVDGVYMRQNPNLNPDDIQSIDVLKDASAAAQYGAQAANGVIVITTKHGRGGPTRLNANAYYGFQDVPKRLDLMNGSQWVAIARDAYTNGAALDPSITTPTGVTNPPSFSTDWQDAVLQTGSIQNTTVGASGGSDMANYLISGGYTKQTGTIIRTGFDRYSLRVNSQGIAGRIRLGENLAFSRSNFVNMNGFPLIDAVRMLPIVPVYDANTLGGYGFGNAATPTFGTNPVGAQLSHDNTSASNQLNGNVFAEAGLPFQLKLRGNLGLGYEDWNGRDFRRYVQLRMNTAPDSAELNELRDHTITLLGETQLTWTGQYGPHQVNATAAYTEQHQTYDRLSASRRGYDNPDLQTINSGTIRVRNGSNDFEANIHSMLARANYTLLDRYILTGSVRRDGSSRFGPGNRWGTFGAGSLGWIVSDEPMFGGIPFAHSLDYLKLRASLGTLGNQDFDNYQYESSITANRNYRLGGIIVPGATQLSLANPDVRWQENREADLGLDLALLNSALSVTADYYSSRSNGTLVRVPVAPSSGSQQSPFLNAASVKNAGFELGVTHKYDRGPFGLNTTLTMTTTRNRVVSLGVGQPISGGGFNVTRTQVGQPIGAFYVRHFAGIYQSAAEVTADCAHAPNAQPGDVRWADLNGDCRIDDNDLHFAGSGIPKLEGGLYFEPRFGAFDAKLGFRGAWGAKIFNAVRYWASRTDDNGNHFADFRPWTPSNPSNSTPRALYGAPGASNAFAASDAYLESGNYIRIQQLELGWRLPAAIGSGRFMLPTGQSRLYVAVNNLHTFTDYTGYDPEVLGFGDILNRGVDDGRVYPNVRTVTLGLSISQ
ncbi:MAG: SusC/RagA family TonB-linked outer membrane protein [Gemmatimonadaceae bacterium]|nr:SusC/RagA family TonB-linked outer membrane protein [Gemmatimonadaceae bacterium]NUQ91626.1 SusC/RagA family TonB-linked outer membrane protein [Gemmatimonadaceae bacterium]NUR19056.1 SusC/RagA family TonB-linked outer membrane protein [Gemmatimonadaceae bacterium]